MEHGKRTELASEVHKNANDQASPLDVLVTVFLSAPKVGWPAFDAIPGVYWRDAASQDNPEATGLTDARYRSGGLVLYSNRRCRG